MSTVAAHPHPVSVLAPSLLHRPTRAIVDLAAVRHNLDHIRELVGRRCGILAVVKADAYGHGMLDVAREALRWGVQGIAVATVDEALILRETGGFGEIPILLAGPSYPEDAETLQAADISVTIGSVSLLRYHLAVARDRRRCPRLHIKIDTGMGRYGFDPDRLAGLDLLAAMPQAFEGLMTHFSVSDGTSGDDQAYTRDQHAIFDRIVQKVRRHGFRPICHAANSGAVLHHPSTHWQMVRPGLLIYGACPTGRPNPRLRQVMTLATRLIAVHQHRAGSAISYGRTWEMPQDGTLGILPVGYGDGLPRSYGNGGHVLLHGRRAPIRGRICMDQTIVDLSHIPEARVGDEVILYGQQGTEHISLEEVAGVAGTIPYEITCQLGGRVPRVVADSAAFAQATPA